MSKYIVGTKIVRYLTAVKRDYGGHFDVIHHQVIAELHATKGWRVIRREAKMHSVRKLPSRSQWRAAFITVFRWAYKIPASNPKWSRGFSEADLKAQMRHRERRRDLRITQNRIHSETEDRQLAAASLP